MEGRVKVGRGMSGKARSTKAVERSGEKVRRVRVDAARGRDDFDPTAVHRGDAAREGARDRRARWRARRSRARRSEDRSSSSRAGAAVATRGAIPRRPPAEASAARRRIIDKAAEPPIRWTTARARATRTFELDRALLEERVVVVHGGGVRHLLGLTHAWRRRSLRREGEEGARVVSRGKDRMEASFEDEEGD